MDRDNNGNPTDRGMSEELAYLQSAGEDIGDLRSELEQVLSGRQSEPAPAPAVQPEQTLSDRLPITEDGQLIEPKPQSKDGPPQQKPLTPQERALDPLTPDGAKPKAEPKAEAEPEQDGEYEPGEVSIDSDGRARDAKTGKYVPHQAMQAERIKRQKLEAELTKYREDAARANERLQVLTEIVHAQEAKVKAPEAKTEAPPEPEIDPEVDIFGWARQQKQRAEAAERKLAEIAQQNQAQYGELQAQQRFRQDVTRFAAQTPDFFESHRFLTAMRKAELEAMDFGDERAIARQIDIEQRALIDNELKRPDGSPAERIYKLARAKGFTKAADPAPAPAPAPAPPPVPDPALTRPLVPQPNQQAAEQVRNIQNGMAASASLSGSGGSPGEGLTIQQLADMSQEKFDELAQKIGVKRLDALLKGR